MDHECDAKVDEALGQFKRERSSWPECVESVTRRGRDAKGADGHSVIGLCLELRSMASLPASAAYDVYRFEKILRRLISGVDNTRGAEFTVLWP